MLKQFVDKLMFYYFLRKPDLPEVADINRFSNKLCALLNVEQQQMLVELEDKYDMLVNSEMREAAWFGFCFGQFVSNNKLSSAVKTSILELINNL